MTILKIEKREPDKFIVGNLYERKNEGDVLMYCQTDQNGFNMIDFQGVRYSFTELTEESFYNLYRNTFIPFDGSVTLTN